MAKICRACGRDFAGSETFCPDDGFRLPSGLSAAHSGDPLLGVTLDGRYRLLRVIGEGGMGVVYEALHVVIEKPVAVKVLRDTFTGRADVVERFRQEAKSASRIGHPNIIDVSDFGETPGGASYIVMEMLTGEDLADILSRERVLAPARAVRIVFQVARALDATHKKAIVHRDLKPENIYLISLDGVPDVVKVVDFGVAKMSDLENTTGRRLTRTGMLFGTPEYMSPEQAAGRAFDHRVDVYALGAIFFELLTGRVPFDGENFMEILSKHGREPLPSLRDVNPGTRVSPELERIVARALAKDPDDRYQTMGELANELRQVPEMPALGSSVGVNVPDWALVAPAPPAAGGSPSTAPVESRRPVLAGLTDRRFAFWAGSVALASMLCVGLIAARSASRTTARPAAPVSQPTAAASLEPEPEPEPEAHDLPETTAAVAALAVSPRSRPESDQAHVELRVRTEPAGASVKVHGKDTDQHCQETPCSVSIPRGQPVQLRATLGGSTIKRRVSYAHDAELELRFAATTPPKTREEPAAKASVDSDLKIPDLFR